MSVSIDGFTILGRYIEIFESVIGPVNLFLQGKALGKVGKQIHNGLKKKKIGDIVQITDNLKYQHSGVYEIKQWNLSAKGNPTIYEFDLGFRHR